MGRAAVGKEEKALKLTKLVDGIKELGEGSGFRGVMRRRKTKLGLKTGVLREKESVANLERNREVLHLPIHWNYDEL